MAAVGREIRLCDSWPGRYIALLTRQRPRSIFPSAGPPKGSGIPTTLRSKSRDGPTLRDTDLANVVAHVGMTEVTMSCHMRHSTRRGRHQIMTPLFPPGCAGLDHRSQQPEAAQYVRCESHLTPALLSLSPPLTASPHPNTSVIEKNERALSLRITGSVSRSYQNPVLDHVLLDYQI